MNSFYASVEMAYDPKLKGKPLAIAGNPEERRGIIVTCSYEARKLGVKTTMPVWEAKKLCPQLIVMKPNFERYRMASHGCSIFSNDIPILLSLFRLMRAMLILRKALNWGPLLKLRKKFKNKFSAQMDLPCSIGIAPNRFLAKMASDMKKPLGITVLRKRDVKQVLWPLPVIEMHGVGKKTLKN